MKKMLKIIFIFSLLFVFSMLFAQDKEIRHAGYATDQYYNELTGYYDLTINIYNSASGGTALWTEVHSSVYISVGDYEIILGSNTPLNLNFDEQYWLGITVDSDPEISPRTKLSMAPYAFNAEDTRGMDIHPNSVTVNGKEVISPSGTVQGFVIENRTSDPDNPVTGQIWLRTDL